MRNRPTLRTNRLSALSCIFPPGRNGPMIPTVLYTTRASIIFGSAVVDSSNTSGFGQNGKIPLVAIFPHHDPVGEKKGSIDYQNQSLAYSLDNGKTWTKYKNNPVLKNPGIVDFRDPSVMWYR